MKKEIGNGVFHLGDCNDIMDSFDQPFIDLTVTSPPYDNLRDYNGYKFDFERTAQNLYRLTKDGGVVVWIVQDATVGGSKTGTSFKQCLRFNEIGFRIHDVMIWEKPNFSFPTSNKYHQIFEYMFIFSKGALKTFNSIKDRKNKRTKNTKASTKRQKNGNLILDKRIIEKKDWGKRYNVWKINPEMSNNKRMHPAQFPEQLIKDHIISWSNEKDTVFDPFGGSGTTAVAAEDTNRKWVLCETSDEYFNAACKRIEKHTNNVEKFFA